VKVFISWSGQRSCDVASALGEWLPQVINAVDPFVSARNLPAGSRWAIEIGQRLENASFGIVCVTKENQSAPWLNYEAGAIAKSIDASRVVPLAIDLAPVDIVEPLSEFQGTRADRPGIEEIVNSINEVCPSSISEKYLNKSFEKWWPDLETELELIEERSYESDSSNSPSPRDERAILEEVLTTVRGLAQRPYLAPPDPEKGSTPINDEIGEILRMAGISSWKISSTENKAVVRPGEPLGRQVLDQLDLLGKLRGRDIQVKNPAQPSN